MIFHDCEKWGYVRRAKKNSAGAYVITLKALPPGAPPPPAIYKPLPKFGAHWQMNDLERALLRALLAAGPDGICLSRLAAAVALPRHGGPIKAYYKLVTLRTHGYVGKIEGQPVRYRALKTEDGERLASPDGQTTVEIVDGVRVTRYPANFARGYGSGNFATTARPRRGSGRRHTA